MIFFDIHKIPKLQFFFLLSYTEPIGSVKPVIKSKTIEIKEVPVGDSFVGICFGQAFPVPVYR